MAQQDKTDWYWNGVLAGAVNNLYYDFINVDVVHVPYATTHRNSSFFLQTRRAYVPSAKWDKFATDTHRDWDVVDIKYIWRDSCSKDEWEVYALLADKWRNNIRIHKAKIENGCVQKFDWNRTNWRIHPASWCWAFELFTTDYVRWKSLTPWSIMTEVEDGYVTYSSGNLALKANPSKTESEERINMVVFNDTDYVGRVCFSLLQYKRNKNDDWTDIALSSSEYVSDYSNVRYNGCFQMTAGDEWEHELEELVKFKKGGYYRIHVEDDDWQKAFVQVSIDKASKPFESDAWIQINKYEGWTTHGYFSDENVENWNYRFMWPGEDREYPEHWVAIWDYILVYKSRNEPWDWFAWQVRMVTWFDWKRIMVDAPWQWFKVLDSDSDEDEVKWGWLSYAIFPEWWEVVGYTQWRNIYIVTYMDDDSFEKYSVYDQTGLSYTDIISVTEAAWKIYILTDNGYVHYSNYSGYDKFFIQDSVFAWVDKTVLTSYRDTIIAFWNKHIAVWVPDENNTYTAMYNQSSTVWLWSRYAYAEYDWDLIFVSNDKRLLALSIANNVWKYMLQYEDVWDMVNSKLSILSYWDEIFIWNDWNDLRVFWQTKSIPYYNPEWDAYANLSWMSYSFDNLDNEIENKYEQRNTMTRIIKFNKQFKVWTEDWVQWILLQWIEWWIYFWENWIYQRSRWDADFRWDVEEKHFSYKSYISAYLIENESDWVWWTNSWLANRAKLYNVAKLNRLITTLWPGEYSHNTLLRITSYVKWLWSVFEFPVDGWNNDWLWLVTDKFTWQPFGPDEEKKLECMSSIIKDSQKAYQPKCVWKPNAAIQNIAQTTPWCDNHDELLTFDKWVCIDDSLYELAPTMPLVTTLWENQDFATQIKLELIWWPGDVISFGGWLWEMYIAPLFDKWPDWEYQLQPNTDC